MERVIIGGMHYNATALKSLAVKEIRLMYKDRVSEAHLQELLKALGKAPKKKKEESEE